MYILLVYADNSSYNPTNLQLLDIELQGYFRFPSLYICDNVHYEK